MECPRCNGETHDPDTFDQLDRETCCGKGRYGCDTEGCTGSEMYADLVPVSCRLCHGNGEVDEVIAFHYALGV